MKSLLSWVLGGVLALALPVFADDHSILFRLELNYQVSDNMPIEAQCSWQAYEVATFLATKQRGLPESKVLADVKKFGLDPVNRWTKADLLFAANAVREVYADDEITPFSPRAFYEVAYSLCFELRSLKSSFYL